MQGDRKKMSEPRGTQGDTQRGGRKEPEYQQGWAEEGH